MDVVKYKYCLHILYLTHLRPLNQICRLFQQNKKKFLAGGAHKQQLYRALPFKNVKKSNLIKPAIHWL